MKQSLTFAACALAIIAIIVGIKGLSPDAGTDATRVSVDHIYPLELGGSPTLPDPIFTPGATNPDITQENIADNICNPHWSTKSIRPPVSYTTPLKIKQIAEYAYADTLTKDYEEDHLISLELGGSPTDPKNLWPEAYAPAPGAREKDKVENFLHKQVCSGAISLAEAQREVSTNWYSVYKTMPAGLLGGAVIDGDDASQ